MKILILGAGGTGGYFGGRLAQAGADVTFLVRPARVERLRRDGLLIRSPLGDADVPVRVTTSEDLRQSPQAFDLAILSCKAYDLDSAIEAIAPAVSERTTVLPILNGLLHYAALDARFGYDNVLGGLCFISATRGPDGEILHLARPASITFGERDGSGPSGRTRAFAALCAQAGITHLDAADIALEQWIKYAYLTALAAGTCLMRGSCGQISAAEGGAEFLTGLYAECTAVAAAEGVPLPEAVQANASKVLTLPGSDIKASMLRDLEAGNRIEGDHIVGDMLRRARAVGLEAPLLAVAWSHLQVYERGRATCDPPSPAARATAG